VLLSFIVLFPSLRLLLSTLFLLLVPILLAVGDLPRLIVLRGLLRWIFPIPDPPGQEAVVVENESSIITAVDAVMMLLEHSDAIAAPYALFFFLILSLKLKY
jgi:hypothetical protein